MGRWPSGLIDGSRLFAKRQSRLWVKRDSGGDGEIQSNLSRGVRSRRCVLALTAFSKKIIPHVRLFLMVGMTGLR